MSFPRRTEGSKGWPLAKSEKVISGGSCIGVREGAQEVKRKEIRHLKARRGRATKGRGGSTANPRGGEGGGSTSIFWAEDGESGWVKFWANEGTREHGACVRKRNPHFEGYEY